eukprot:COSAG01_NODE_1176_length_11374_cov_476.847805_7_plen_137_part_00
MNNHKEEKSEKAFVLVHAPPNEVTDVPQWSCSLLLTTVAAGVQVTEIILKEIRSLTALQSKSADANRKPLTVGLLKGHDHHIETLCSQHNTTLEKVLHFAQDRDLINLVRGSWCNPYGISCLICLEKGHKPMMCYC